MFLIDKETDELVAKVFDGIQANNDNEVSYCHSHIHIFLKCDTFNFGYQYTLRESNSVIFIFAHYLTWGQLIKEFAA